MIDKDLAIKVLSNYSKFTFGYESQKYGGKITMQDIIDLLIEKPIDPIIEEPSMHTNFKHIYHCGKCKSKIAKTDLYCKHCGQAVKQNV